MRSCEGKVVLRKIDVGLQLSVHTTALVQSHVMIHMLISSIRSKGPQLCITGSLQPAIGLRRTPWYPRML
jgi:hypothetical protein